MPSKAHSQKEYVIFRVYRMPCCGHILCWLNERHPVCCPQCGKFVFDVIRGEVLFSDRDAWLFHKPIDIPISVPNGREVADE